MAELEDLRQDAAFERTYGSETDEGHMEITFAAQLLFWLIRPALPASREGFDLAGFPGARLLILYRLARSILAAAAGLFLQLLCAWWARSNPSSSRFVRQQRRTSTPRKSPLSELAL
jgi:hypothetical protein